MTSAACGTPKSKKEREKMTMKKRILSLVLTLALCMGLAPAAWAATTTQAVHNTSKIYVDGTELQMAAYTINQSNYFKLRDLAYVLSGTGKQFNVSWDSARGAVEIQTGRAYTPSGQEMTPVAQTGAAVPSLGAFVCDGQEIRLTAYQIGGNNFVKLRDVGALLDFAVEWDAATGAIAIDSSKGYTPDPSRVLSQAAREALAEMTYYGDRSKCQMSKAQIEAYAQTVRSFPDVHMEVEGISPTELDVFLADFEDNGNPYLVIVRPAPGVGYYQPVVYSYINNQVQEVVACFNGSAATTELEKLKDGHFLCLSTESDGHTRWTTGSFVLFDGGLAEIPAPGENQTVYDRTFSDLCHPGFEENPNCQNSYEAAESLMKAAGYSAPKTAQMAQAMLNIMDQFEKGKAPSGLVCPFEYGGLNAGDPVDLTYARLLDLNGDGVQELIIGSGKSTQNGFIFQWVDGELRGFQTPYGYDGTVDLVREKSTGEYAVHLEEAQNPNQNFYLFLDRTDAFNNPTCEMPFDYPEYPRLSAEHEANLARYELVEPMVTWDTNTGSFIFYKDAVAETRAALTQMLLGQ